MVGSGFVSIVTVSAWALWGAAGSFESSKPVAAEAKAAPRAAGHHPGPGSQELSRALARALVNEPDVVLADEPTGNLASRTSIEIMGVFQALNDAGITIVMVTHELDIAAYCKRIIVMRDGEILSDLLNEKRQLAASELARLNQAERQVKLA